VHDGSKLSNPADQASHRLFDSPMDQESIYDCTRGHRLAKALLVAATAIGMVEAIAYFSFSLQIWESYLLTPVVPILVTFALFIEHEIRLRREPWRKHMVRDDFSKSSLMIVGAIIVDVGLVVFMSSISTEILRVTVDAGAGSTMICIGIYIVKRFSW
jgi:hypothetical protein